MGNLVSNEQIGDKSRLKMSNGATSVFVSLLSLATSRIAATENQILLSTCIASCDQSVFGLGIVGFDLADLPWTRDEEEFAKEKNFLISSIERVISRSDWGELDYTPSVDRALHNQRIFLEMVNLFQLENVQEFNQSNFRLPEPLGETCQKHGVYLHIAGCVICHDTAQ